MLDRLSEYDLEECSKVCDVPVDVMTQLAEDIAVNKPCALYILLGIDHYQNGFYSIYDMGCLAAMTGNIGKPGAFCGISEPVYFGLENAASRYGAYTLADATPSTVNVPVFRMEEALEAGEWLGNPYTLKALWVYKRNLLANLCDRESMLRWLEKVELIVVSGAHHERDGPLRRHLPASVPLVRDGGLRPSVPAECVHHHPGQGH